MGVWGVGGELVLGCWGEREGLDVLPDFDIELEETDVLGWWGGGVGIGEGDVGTELFALRTEDEI